jgi:hypothetical protein
MSAITTDNGQQKLGARKHIMISYNRATATTVCQKIYDRLTVNIEQICEKINSSKKTFFDLYE